MTATPKYKLILLSSLLFFVELTLIRWTSATIYHLFLFTHFILLASFLGMGLGFMRTNKTVRLFPWAPLLLAILIALCDHYGYHYQPQLNIHTGNLNYASPSGRYDLYTVIILLPILFVLIVTLMQAITEKMAVLFKQLPPLQAYRADIVGSLIGITGFSLCAYCQHAPLEWGIGISLLFMPFLSWRSLALILIQLASLLLIISIFSKASFLPGQIWSTYAKITLQPFAPKQYVVTVNGLAQQIIEPAHVRERIKPFYTIPYQTLNKNNLNRILIIGAGTGGDVAIALSHGAQWIDAVEIDPLLYQLGKQFNSDRPYYSPRTHITFNDGRAFLQQAHQPYDMIIFALTDSLMLLLGQSSLRLENYLYTQESLTRAYQLLKPTGRLVIYNYYQPSWFVDRLANTLAIATKQTPCVERYGAQDYWATVLMVSKMPTSLFCKQHWQPTHALSEAPTTDDHPFLYLKETTLSAWHLFWLGLILSLTLLATRLTQTLSALKTYPDLLLMGAAFLLLETKNLVNFALLFGSTWFVNTWVFIGILSIVYLAIEVTERYPQLPTRWLISILYGTLGIAWYLPNAALLTLPFLMRFIIATIVAFGPIFVANLIFAKRFQQTHQAAQAFGVNLIGAMIGGLLEYGAILIGYRHLLLLVTLLYTTAILLRVPL